MTVLTAIILLGAVCVVTGIVLAVTEKIFAVEDNPLLEKITAALPGVNCGACGFPGCAGYAAAVAHNEAAPNRCTVGGARVAAAISAITGAQVGAAEKYVARLFCRGGKKESSEKFEYRGITSCAATVIVASGNKACAYGCLGMGDCVDACQFDALVMGDNRLPVVIEDKCVACGKCVQTCPRSLFELVPKSKTVLIPCRSQDSGQDTRKACTIGCIACGICVKKCPATAIKIVSNHAVIDPARCTICGACVKVCPRKIIIDVAPSAK